MILHRLTGLLAILLATAALALPFAGMLFLPFLGVPAGPAFFAGAVGGVVFGAAYCWLLARQVSSTAAAPDADRL